MEVKLIKIDRNGSKHFEGMVTCDRCSGKGYYTIGIHNNRPVLSPHDNGVCWKCHGKGKIYGKWIERTPEYQAKLDAKRQAKLEARQAKLDAERAERAERKAQIKTISQYIGQIGDKVEIKGTYVHSGSWTQKSFRGWGTDTMYVHIFKDSDGNVFTWKTKNGLPMEYGELVIVKGTIKNHSEYKDEKQNELTRCKITMVGQ